MSRAVIDACAAIFLFGLVVGVRAMLKGIERPASARQLRRMQRRGKTATPARRFSVNGPTVAGFAMAFGATGYLVARYTHLSLAIDVAIAVAAGLAGAVGALSLVAAWAIPAAESEQVDERYVMQGAFARVLTVTDGGAAGTVRYEVDGVAQTSPAAGLDGIKLETGADVVIERIEGGVAYVEPWARVEARL
jgi:membrane protein implicated in regulation of membrane protease activity